MYEDPEEEEELWTIIMDEGLMSIMMTMPFDRMKMENEGDEEENEEVADASLDANPVNVAESDKPVLELIEQLTKQGMSTSQNDATNVKVGKPPGSKKKLMWLKTMWVIVPDIVRQWANNVVTSHRAWGEDIARK